MAETIAGPFVSFAVKRLADLLIQEGKFFRMVSDQVQQMQTELTRMQCFLKDAAAKREDGDKRVRNWIAEIREAAYDAEDVIDTFIVKVAFRRGTGAGILNVFMRYSSSFKNLVATHKVAVEIVSITTRISSIRTSLEIYGIKATSEGESSSSRYERQRLLRQSYPHFMEEDIVGLDEDLETILNYLLMTERQCRVVSIWGMGGLGKTTLAKKVYNHYHVRKNFEAVAWAFISQQCKTREVLEGILVDLTSPSLEERKKIKIMFDGELFAELCRFQSRRKCLVVIDDIWKVEDWKILSPAFPNNEFAYSKILLTTRIKEVATGADQLHVLRHLTEIESWNLFQKKAILKRNVTEFELSPRMLELGKQMVKHCEGLPSAIVVLGEILSTQHKMDKWEMVSRNISYHLNNYEGQGGLSISDNLSLSYQDLPSHLKVCFLHLSHFPRDYDIRAEKLIQMWMAEDIVEWETTEELTTFNVGMRYLGELAERCMVQVKLTRFSRRIKLCHLHNLMRDFCLLKAQEENFYKVVHVNKQFMWADSSSSSSTVGRLVVHYLGDHDIDSTGYVKKITNPRHVRQLYFFRNKIENSSWEQIKSLLMGLKLLRVLDVEGVFLSCAKMLLKDIGRLIHLKYLSIRDSNIEELPSSIGRLIHLEYLSIRNSNIKELPSSIGNLVFLQTLDLRPDAFSKILIPNVLWRLEQLRHLYLPSFMELPSTDKLQLDGLSKLETLKGFTAEYCDVGFFPKLTNLRKVNVWVDNKDLAVILQSPSSNPLLQYSSFYIAGDIQTEAEHSLLRQLLRCHHLHKLDLCNTKLEEDPMPTLEKLPNLTKLDLRWDSYIGKEMVCSSAPTATATPTASSSSSGGGGYGCNGGFPQLKFLRLLGIPNLEEWRAEEGSMSTLFHLEIYFCPKLKEIPNGLRFITTLRELKIRGVSQVLKEDFYKVQHVPSITIFDY